MNYRKNLFTHKDPYDQEATHTLFLKAVKHNVAFHRKNCPEYRKILKAHNFQVSSIKSIHDIYKIPPLPTLYFKRNRLFSVKEKKLLIKATSSGTKGQHSFIGFDFSSLYYGIRMMLHFFSYYHVVSFLPTNYIILGYAPTKRMKVGAVKTAYGASMFAPGLHREYALKDTGSDYQLNIDGIKKALLIYAKMPFPVRFIGFPSYMYFLTKALKSEGISLQLPPRSKVLLGGGWKQFTDEKIDEHEFYQLIEETLGIKKENCLEFFSAVEHPLPYCKCENGHFHVPIYSRVIIRDVQTLEPVGMNKLGLLSFVSPLVTSVPMTSVITDDLAILREGKACNCPIETPYFELKGRAGVQQIKTCTTDAAALLNLHQPKQK